MTSYTLKTTATSLDTGLPYPSGYAHLWTPSKIRGANKYGVVLLHGANTSAQYCGIGSLRATELAARLALVGIPCVAGFMDPYSGVATGDNWGGPDLLPVIDNAIAYMAAQTGCSSAKAHLIGTSMGAAGTVHYAETYPAKVASAIGMIPLVNLRGFYNANVIAASAAIAARWGVTAPRTATDGVTNGTTTVTSATMAFVAGDVGKVLQGAGIPVGATILSQTGTACVISSAATASATGVTIKVLTALPAASNFLGNAAAMSAIPSKWYYSASDAYIVPGDVTAFATAVGGTAVSADPGAFGHTDATVGEVVDRGPGAAQEIIDFLKANGA